MARNNLVHVPAPPLPADIDEWQRAIKAERTLNDLVEDVHRVLVGDETPSEDAEGRTRGERYLALLRATYDAHAVEGSLAADNTLAAMMIREKAEELGNVEVKKEKLAIINMALGVVLRRYKSSRKQRRNMVHGEEVPNENNGD
jgi:hypothetical protein